ncbi:hypothetical protein ACB092_12G163800 [Castanea dentata]
MDDCDRAPYQLVHQLLHGPTPAPPQILRFQLRFDDLFILIPSTTKSQKTMQKEREEFKIHNRERGVKSSMVVCAGGRERGTAIDRSEERGARVSTLNGMRERLGFELDMR